MAAFDLVLVIRRQAHPSGDDGEYQIGDIVAVYGPEKDPGAGPFPAQHCVVVLTGIDIAGATLDKAIAKLTGRNLFDETAPNPVLVNKRRWYIDWQNLPAAIKNTLADPDDGYINRSWAVAKSFFRHKAYFGAADAAISDDDLT